MSSTIKFIHHTGKFLHSTWYRNVEDIVFYDEEFNALAYQIATGEHTYEKELSNIGWHYFFTTPEYILKVTWEYDTSASIQIKSDTTLYYKK
ncbi:hypothetical protein H8S95_09230 [Pontibacter sp. KCTC 32443]|uniref:hypothetical protein n=1 Tax=Pontibacter TaxID=323449 RepID=UPI00164D5028|nr:MULTISPECIES: hypothetical protein [Pontibacter]MBC5774243.1 hypothetical protein [Pontibacter sp. KCTC 32443]